MTHLHSSEWDVWTVPSHGEAVAFLRSHHYAKSAPNTSTYRHGIYPVGLFGRLAGVALWIPPTKAAAQVVAGDDWQGVLSLSRLAIEPDMPTNAASFLLGRSMRLIDRDRWPVLVTYADTAQGHTGAIYRATNWMCDGEVPAGDTWVMPDGSQCGRKRGGRTLTAAEMRAIGAERSASLPKIRFRHDARRTALIPQ